MKIRRKNGLKVAAITIALLLCLALAVGITGAWYQAQRQATGTLSMDQGIIIDYKGFGQTPDEGIWSRDTTTTFLLFDETNAQPGEEIAVNAAGIRANENSVNFYARVKLTYKFYNGETPVELADATKLIKTSSSFFGSNWVDCGGADGYYYYATGSTLNKFEKGAVATTPFVDLFADGAYLEIAGENFVGADNNGEGGGFVVGDTSINKIEVYLTLETLQGDATAEQAKALGWKIAKKVDFSQVKDNATFVKTGDYSEGVSETYYTDAAEIEEMQNVQVTIDDQISSPLNEIKFSYGKETILEFDSLNVEYIQLKYKNGDNYKLSEKFYDTQETGNVKITILADENEEVGGYIVGWFSSKEYKGFGYTTKDFTNAVENFKTTSLEGVYATKTLLSDDKIAITKYFGSDDEVKLPSKQRVRQRNFEYVLLGQRMSLCTMADMFLLPDMFPVVLVETDTKCENFEQLAEALANYKNSLGGIDESDVATLRGKLYVSANNNILYKERAVANITPYSMAIGYGYGWKGTKLTIPGNVEILSCGDHDYDRNPLSIFGYYSTTIAEEDRISRTIIIEEGCESLRDGALSYSDLISLTLPSTLKSIGNKILGNCFNNIETIIIKSNYCVFNYNSLNNGKIKNIYVPAELLDEYKAADGWKDVADKIQAIS